MNDTKSIISSLRSLSTSIEHTDITKSTLFQDAAAEIERLDKALYEEKEKTRRLTRELSPLKQYDRERREIVTLKAKTVVASLCDVIGTEKASKGPALETLEKLLDLLRKSGLIEWEIRKCDGTWTAEATIRVLEPRGELIPADPGWFSRNRIDTESPLMTE